uniref:Uncharacterized protein n=1 Tax=Sphaeramia orbicularis TaxID=375764 RepID=A0A673A7P5_9TELE
MINGHAERAVQIAKTILRQDDPLLALMTYRATPNSSTGASPAELLMGRKLRTTLPILQDNLKPCWPDMDKIQQADASAKQKQAHFYNRRNGGFFLTVNFLRHFCHLVLQSCC